MDYTINQKAKDALNRLAAMPGMSAVKDQVEQMVQMKRIAELRKQNRLKSQPQTNHMIFTGSPGTGKTTAARLIGEAFAAIGLLKTTSSEVPFIEVSNSDIARPHVGESEKMIVTKFKQAKGGILFIDEAYSLMGRGDHATDMKVISAIVQLTENMRDEVVVIAAGYQKDMAKFMAFNSGLASRFPTTIHFPDYAVPELVQIAQQMLLEQEYQAAPDYLDALASVMWIEKSRPNFGNARTVRNHVERSIRRQAVRVSQIPRPSRKDLALITATDLVHSVQDVKNSEKEMLQETIKAAQTRLFELDMQSLLKQQIP